MMPRLPILHTLLGSSDPQGESPALQSCVVTCSFRGRTPCPGQSSLNSAMAKIICEIKGSSWLWRTHSPTSFFETQGQHEVPQIECGLAKLKAAVPRTTLPHPSPDHPQGRATSSHDWKQMNGGPRDLQELLHSPTVPFYLVFLLLLPNPSIVP